MKISVLCYPHDSVEKVLALADTAEELGVDSFYLTDSSYRRDPWALLGAIAGRTSRIRVGPNVARLLLTDPLVVARGLATIDEMSAGRVDGGIGPGYPATLKLLADTADPRPPLPFMREAITVIRHALAHPTIDFKGKYLSYHITGVPMTAQAVQKPIPLFYGSCGGPKMMELAGELLDGVHITGYKRAAIEHAQACVRRGAERAGRDWRSVDVAILTTIVCSEDGEAAREAARIWATYYLGRAPMQPALVPEFTARGFTPKLLEEIAALFDAGDLRGAVAKLPYELAEFIAIGGTPDECLASLRKNISGTGINHVVFGVADVGHMRMLIGSRAEEVKVPTAAEQLALLQKHVSPRLDAMAAA